MKLAAIALLGALALTGCTAQQSSDTGIASSTVPLPDHRHVVCVNMWDRALTCDWTHAK